MLHQKQLKNVKYFNCLGSIITNDARCTREIKSRTSTEKKQHSKKRRLFTSKLDLNLRKKIAKCYIWSIALYGDENWMLRKVD
jgi:hypothetical protein